MAHRGSFKLATAKKQCAVDSSDGQNEVVWIRFRSNRTVTGKTPYELYFKQPSFSLYATPSRHDLTPKEGVFVDTAHLDVPGEPNFEDAATRGQW